MAEEIVITGISGRYPECNSVEEFKTALLNGTDLLSVDDRRFPPGLFGTPERGGKIADIEFFDNVFFGIHQKQANCTDPGVRKFLECAFEAIIDAGYNPKELRGSRTAVFTATTPFDSAENIRENVDTSGYATLGLSPTICPNRVSYCFDFKGPSYAVDSACSSGLYTLNQAYNAIEKGDCDAAVVGSVHTIFHPKQTLEFKKMNMLSPDGKCKVFNDVRDGYVRTEAIVALFVQKKTAARRIYSTILGVKLNCDGYKKEGITYPSSTMQIQLIKEIYEEANINPIDVAYVEAHGTGTPSGDIQECQSILEAFCKGRKEPLAIGSVKSNMGHSETSAGLCSVTKCLIAMETGVIPANLHFEKPASDIPGIVTGKLKVVDENQPLNGHLVALNSFGFGGANAHLILKIHDKPKPKYQIRTEPRLVQASARTSEATTYFLDEIEKHQNDNEFLALIDEIHKINVDGHLFRGYAVLGTNQREIQQINYESRPIWFVYSGMGCQWPGMGKDIMKIPIIRNTIQRCANALKPYDIDLEELITNPETKALDDIVNCFPAITAIQIALTDFLKSLNIIPDGYFGHSLGEVGASYAEGNLTPEQAVLIAYARGYGTINAKLTNGLMAAIGLSKEECAKRLPENVFIACYNSKTSVTISGDSQNVTEFVKQLSAEGIFARIVNTGNYAYHSKFIADAGPLVYKFIENIVTDPKPRSSKWISTSVPEDQWNTEVAKYNSAKYQTNNFLNPVLFDQVYKHIPENAIIVEMAPHGLLQGILKSELKPTVTNLSLLHRNCKDNLEFLLTSLGKMFLNGQNPNLRKLYDGVQFPVSRGTPMIGSMVKWDHSTKLFIPKYKIEDSFGKIVTVDISNEEYSHMVGHKIDNRVLLPATGYLVLVWKVFAELTLKNIDELPIIFENINYKRATVLKDGPVDLLINIMKATGYFEIFESSTIVVTGYIKMPKNIEKEFLNPSFHIDENEIVWNNSDIYKELHLRRYTYSGLYQGIKESNISGTAGTLIWNDNWISFLDTMLQSPLLGTTNRDLILPTGIQKVVINPQLHLQSINQDTTEIPFKRNKNLKLVKSGGVEIINPEVSKAPKRQQIQTNPILECHDFIPNETILDNFDRNLSLKIAFGLILENVPSSFTITVQSGDETLVKKIVNSELLSFGSFVEFQEENNYDIIVTDDVSTVKNVKPGGFLIYSGSCDYVKEFNLPIVFQQIFSKTEGLFLLRNLGEIPQESIIIPINNNEFSWIDKIKSAQDKNYKRIYLVSQGDPISGLVGLVKCLLREPGGEVFRGVFIDDNKIEEFSFSSIFYSRQLKKDLTINVLRNGIWGSYRHIPIREVGLRKVKHAAVAVLSPGDLTSLKWVERPLNYHEAIKNEFCKIYYAPLNFKDVMLATAKLHTDTPDITANNVVVGLEYSGITKSGERIMGITAQNSISLNVESVLPALCWRIPNSWTLEEAATVPIVYATCYYALVERGRIQQGESILIHAGAGGVGIAAITIALSFNCQIFCTVGSDEKKQFLKELFPQLIDSQIGNSRNSSFEKLILEKTNGKGVDLILNSLSSDLFQTSLRCLAIFGRFLEIGKVDGINGTLINSKIFLKNCSFHGVHLDEIMSFPSVQFKIKTLVEEGIRNGIVRPLPRTVFDKSEIEAAIRFLATGKHKGKVVIKIRDEKEKLEAIEAIPRIYFDSEKVYVLIGGLGGFGLELCQWLMERGATKLIVNTRRNKLNGYQSFVLKKLRQNHVIVEISNHNTAIADEAEKLILYAESFGKVGGIFNMALVLKDSLIKNQTEENFVEVFQSKIYSGQNLDFVSRKHCTALDYFVVFSSMACGRGNAGQSNYGMANSALERLCEQRRLNNLPGLAIQWGPIGDVGYLEKIGKQNEAILGLEPQNINSCLNSLDKLFLQSSPIVASAVFHDESLHLKQAVSGNNPADVVSHVMGIKDIKLINPHTKLVQLGLDSLMAAEIKQVLFRSFDIDIDVSDIPNLSIQDLQNYSNSKSHKKEITEQPFQNGDKNHLEVIPKEIIVNLRQQENENNIFLIHPIEGHIEILKPLAKKLLANVYGLQSTREILYDTLEDSATTFIQHIKTIQKSGPYLLCGYSYGSTVAFEIAVQLEKSNEKVDLIFIDGSPNYIKTHLLQEFGKDKYENISDNLKQFTRLFNNVNHDKAEAIHNKPGKWEDKIKNIGNFLANETGFESEEIATAALLFCKRCWAAAVYNPTSKFRGKLVLIRSVDEQSDLTEDYNLNEICEKKVTVYKINGDHKGILLGDNLNQLANIINSNILV